MAELPQLHHTITPAVILDHAQRSILDSDRETGICVACGGRYITSDPDAEGDPCDFCGKPAVYGAEQLLLMGFADE